MTVKDYQTPQLQMLLFENQDVVTMSVWEGESESNIFDKGVEDFF